MARKGFLLCMALCVIALLSLAAVVFAQPAAPLTLEEELGKSIFFDENLSFNLTNPAPPAMTRRRGGRDPTLPSMPAARSTRDRSLAHSAIASRRARRTPPRARSCHVDRKGLFVGGNFWDGRATGETLGSPAAEQAKGPFLNPVEQALPSAAELVTRVCAADLRRLIQGGLGRGVRDPANVAIAYDNIGYSVAAYEASPEVNAFTSKFDLTKGGKVKLSKEEQRGYALFRGKGKCSACHVANGQRPLFTDYTFDNLGVPKNPENPVYVTNPDFVDKGLGGFLATRPDYAAYADANMGKHKVPTVRNVGLGLPALTKAYGHNGYFKTLEGIVNFYNTRDVKPECPDDYTQAQALAAGCWPAPEVSANVNTAELGNLGLSPDEEAAIVAFLKALSDGYQP